MSKFNSLSKAVSWVNNSELSLTIIHGDDGLFWVVGGSKGRKLIAQGYERAMY